MASPLAWTPPAGPASAGDATGGSDAAGDAAEPAWADEEMTAAHEALDALLNRARPED